MKLCVFQGTFNPIHKAHLKMAEFVLNEFHFDNIIFIPAFKPPQKEFNEENAMHRLNMVKIATKYNNKFIVSDIEYKTDNISYTYLTIKKLYKQYDVDGKINFIIGTDAFNNIDSWYEADKLKEMLHFIVFSRGDEPKGKNYTLTKMEFTDISSTKIRDMIKNNKNVSDYITKEVEEYIKKNGLYKIN